MRDPREGVTSDGLIVTGVDRAAVPPAFEPVLAALGQSLSGRPDVASYLYGSVATGEALTRSSDVDVLTIGLPTDEATAIGRELSTRFGGLCREVALAPAQPDELVGDDDPAYGLRVFVRHYCVHLDGPDPARHLEQFPADARAARGFNGDIHSHLQRWRTQSPQQDPAALGRRVARKTLLATAGLVSVLDTTWTTDRERAVELYLGHRSERTGELLTLLGWSTGATTAEPGALAVALAPEGIVDQIVAEFRDVVGLWPATSAP